MKKILCLVFSLAIATAHADTENDCSPSKWGPEDEIGSANLVTPERVAAAARLVRKGKSVPLGIVIDSETPAFPPRGLSLQVVSPGQAGGNEIFDYGGIYNDDLAHLWFGIGSQLDGLGHLGEKGYYYNCNSAAEISQVTGLTRLGVHNVPPLVGRGVLIDIARHRGVTHLEAGDAISAEEIRAAAAAQGVKFQEGDVILLHTGWTDAKFNSDPAAWGSSEPGIDNDAARYLAGLNPLAVGADTWGLGPVPYKSGDKEAYEHVILLKHNGIYILETMNTGLLVAEGVQEFMFVLGQARIRGTVQMVINPVAMW
jgi:kynurenine formamidase